MNYPFVVKKGSDNSLNLYQFISCTKKKKSEIPNEFVQTTGYNRSYARCVLGSLKKVGRKRKYSPRNRIYDAEVFYALRKIWIVNDNICGQRLKPQIAETIRKLELFHEYRFKKAIKRKLLTITLLTRDTLIIGI